MSEIEERRQRAREAGLDDLITDDYANMDAAIETATRVRITPEIIEAMRAAHRVRGVVISMPGAHEALTAAFEAAGFEVEA